MLPSGATKNGTRFGVLLIVATALLICIYVSSVPSSILPSQGFQNHPFPGRNPEAEEKLNQIYALLEPFVTDLEQVGKNLSRQGLPWKGIQGPLTLINAYKADYFDNIAQFPQVKTFLFKVSPKDIKRLLLDKYFGYATTKCSLIEGRSIYGGGFGQSAYNATCYDDLNNRSIDFIFAWYVYNFNIYL